MMFELTTNTSSSAGDEPAFDWSAIGAVVRGLADQAMHMHYASGVDERAPSRDIVRRVVRQSPSASSCSPSITSREPEGLNQP